MHYYPFNPSAYYLSTGHWSEDRTVIQIEAGLVRDLAYRRLLDLYYGEEEPIPSKTRLVAIRIRMLKHEDIVAAVLKEKFTLKDGFWTQDRAEEEIEKYQRRAAASRENGKKGGRPKTNGKPSKTKQVPGRLQLRTRTRTRYTPLPPEGEAWWEEFWKAYPRKAKKPDAYRAFAKALGRAPSFEAIMAGLRKHLSCEQWADATKIPHPATWLNADQWDDEPVVAPSAGDADRAEAWWNSAKGILDKGIELGMPGPAEASGVAFLRYTAAVWLEAGDGPWVDERGSAYPFYVRLRNGE